LKECGVERTEDIDVELLAFNVGLLVNEDQLSGAEARLLCNDRVGMIVVNRRARENGRKRFGVAHEIGHFVRHRNKYFVSRCTSESFLDWRADSSLEGEANAFAAELLMPDFLFEPRLVCDSPSFDVVENLASEFKTTLTATAIRFVELTSHACALFAVTDRKVKWFSVSKYFPYRVIGSGTSISKHCVANDFFDGKAVPQIAETVIGSAWIEDFEVGENCLLKEEARELRSYGIVLSFVSIEEDRNPTREK
jgi:Zn-dependent peptidase ImmA (M78 family)